MNKDSIVFKEIKAKVISISSSLPHSLKERWKEPNQIITYMYNENLYVAIDNLLDKESKNNTWKGQNFRIGEIVTVNIHNNSGFHWIEKIGKI